MTSPSSPFADAVGRLTAPEHGGDFFDDLWRRIEREGREGPEPVGAAAPSRPTPLRRLRVATLSIAAAAAAVLAVVFVLYGLPGVRSTRPEPATAASVGLGIGKAMQSWDTFEATMFLRSDLSSEYSSDPVTSRVHVTLSSAGGERWEWLSFEGPARFRQLDPRKGDIEAYDPETHENQIYRQRESETGQPSLLVAESAFPASLGPLQPYAAAARAMLAEQDPDAPVERVVVDGRPAWRLELSQPGDEWKPRIPRDGELQVEELEPRGFDVASRLIVTVDAATGMPLRMIGRDGKGRIVGELRLQNVKVNVGLPAGIFRLDAAGAQVGRVTNEPDVRAVSLSEVEATTGRPPLVPSRIPSGYSLATTCVVRRYRSGVAVELFYRRGLDVFVVATGPQEFHDWGDGLSWLSLRDRVSELRQGLYDSGDGLSSLSLRDRASALALPSDLSAPLHEQKGTLTAGALAGREFSTTISARWAPAAWRGPSLWTTDAGSRLVITGTLTRAELIDVAESLEPWNE